MLLARVFTERHKTGAMDLEAIELALRASLHQAGATALTALLQFDPPSPNQRQLPCACGHTASYVGLRSKSLLTVVDEARGLRPYLWSTATTASFQWMPISISRIPNYHPACAG